MSESLSDSGRPESDAEIRGVDLLKGLERALLFVDRAVERNLPTRHNPLLQMGAIANALLIVALASGVLLLFWYIPNVEQAWESVHWIEERPWGAGLVRSFHRYSSDAAMFFILVHGLRTLLERRFSGARWLGWVTGIVLLGSIWITGWTGYWLVWDIRAQVLATGTAEMIDALPVFVTPLARSFLTEETLSSALYFTVFFVHLLLPLVIGLGLWLHVSRLRRARFLPSREMWGWLLASLIIVSILKPALSAPRADLAALPAQYTVDWWYLAPTVLFERLSSGALWSLAFGALLVTVSIPWSLVYEESEKAEVNSKFCNACSRCVKDCPYGAIVMAPRSDDHPRHDLEARLNPDRCVGCGICAGACEPGGIGLPSYDVQEIRRRVDAWIEEAEREDEQISIAFVCSESAGGQLTIESDSGRCRELEGYRVVSVPCTGWVSPLTVERALRKGASGVLVVGCREEGPYYREGTKWIRQRLEGRREPRLRESQVDSELVKLVTFNRTERAELLRHARSAPFGKNSGGGCSAANGRFLRAGWSLIVAICLAIPVVMFSDFSGFAHAVESSRFVFSFNYRPPVEEQCEKVTEEEQAKLPEHMRVDERCERRRPPVRVRIDVDGKSVRDGTYHPSGFSSDGPAVAVETVPLEPGRHDLRIKLTTVGESGGEAKVWSDTIQTRAGRRRVLLNDEGPGFRLE